jgi:hypothetical protein
MAAWQNPYQTKEERDARIRKLLEKETDPDAREVLELILTDDRGVVYVTDDGSLRHLEWKIRGN